jgi:acetylornithine deacetylase/succinyl-diaminopimelate desuccinylase-like protein
MSVLDESFETDKERILKEWKTLLSFPSISTDSTHHPDCLACADWLRDHLNGIGFQAELLETDGKPVVFAERKGAEDAPTILFYGHYDVQPVDPVEAWDSPPFTPTLVDGRMVARGAQDNKGQHFYVLKALEHLIKTEALTPTVKVFLEGEEECGSTGITACMPNWKDKLKSDILLVTDLGMTSPTQPTLTMSLRGIIHMTVELSGPRTDLHSGMHGGLAPNPATAMCRLLASLHNDDGSIAVSNFYDGIQPISPTEKTLADAMAFDVETYKRNTGVEPVGGEADKTPVERLGLRPALDCNGVHSGFNGEGSKTIIPAHARAKLTARIAAGQDPQQCLTALINHLHTHSPKGLTLKISDEGVGGVGLRLDPASELISRGKTIADTLTDNEAVYRWEGASIPVIADLAAVAEAEPLMVGFGCEEDNIHAPNESFSIERFHMGYTFAKRFFQSFD